MILLATFQRGFDLKGAGVGGGGGAVKIYGRAQI